MYYVKLNTETASLVYYCRNCGNEDTDINADTCCILNTQMNPQTSLNSFAINKFNKYDPTLPRINTIKCPNVDCETNTAGVEREIIYTRYSVEEMKYGYLCTTCDSIWTIKQ